MKSSIQICTFYYMKNFFIVSSIIFIINRLSIQTEIILFREAADNLISISCWMRGHYTKSIKNNKVTCNQCNEKLLYALAT